MTCLQIKQTHMSSLVLMGLSASNDRSWANGYACVDFGKFSTSHLLLLIGRPDDFTGFGLPPKMLQIF